MTKVRCAIVGLGRIGWMLERDRLREKPCTHAGAILDNNDCLLVGGCDLDSLRCESFSDTFGISHIYTNVTELLEKTTPDILHIATPTESHYSIMQAALTSDVKLLVCEKPLVENSRVASHVAKWQRRGRIKILLNHERRYSRDYLRAKRKINYGSFGQILSVASSLYMGGSAAVSDVLLHDGTHLIDIIQFLTGSELRLLSVQHFREGKAIVITGSSGCVPVTLEIGSGRHYILFELDINFSRGRIRIGNGLYEEYASAPSPFYEKMRSLRRTGGQRPKVTGYFRNMLKDAVRCVRDGKRTPVSSAEEGLSVLRFIDAVKRHVVRGKNARF